MSYTGTQVYFPSSTRFEAVRDVLANRFPEAKLSAADDRLTLAFDDVKVVRVSRDAAEHVPEEAVWLGSKASDAATRAALGRASHRYEIVPDDPRADPDDLYNELLWVFEVLREMPDAVGADPFDGALYHTALPTESAPVPTATKRARRPGKKPTKATKATTKPQNKPSAKRKPVKRKPVKRKPVMRKPAKRNAATSKRKR